MIKYQFYHTILFFPHTEIPTNRGLYGLLVFIGYISEKTEHFVFTSDGFPNKYVLSKQQRSMGEQHECLIL